MNKCISIADRLFLYMVFICPQYDLLAPLIPYGCSTWVRKVHKSQLKMLKKMLLLWKWINNEIVECLCPIDLKKRRNLNIKRIYHKLINWFQNENFDEMINFENIKEIFEEKDVQIYKTFQEKCDKDINITDQINKIGAYTCELCPRWNDKEVIISLAHLEEHLGVKFDKETLLNDFMKEKKIFNFINLYGKVAYIYN